MAAYAKPCNGSALFRYNIGGTKEVRGWNKGLSYEIYEWASY